MEPVIACGRHVLALDVGSTTVRSIVYDDRGAVVGQAATPVKYMQVGRYTAVPLLVTK
jgi:ribulose kinase